MTGRGIVMALDNLAPYPADLPPGLRWLRRFHDPLRDCCWDVFDGEYLPDWSPGNEPMRFSSHAAVIDYWWTYREFRETGHLHPRPLVYLYGQRKFQYIRDDNTVLIHYCPECDKNTPRDPRYARDPFGSYTLVSLEHPKESVFGR